MTDGFLDLIGSSFSSRARMQSGNISPLPAENFGPAGRLHNSTR